MTALLGRVGNASSLHASGREARRVVEESRERIAKALRCRPGEVVFTSGGTESDNLAIKGLYWSRRAEDPRRVRILSTPIEHHAVLDPLDWLRHRGREGRADRGRPPGPSRRRRVPRGRRVRPRQRRAGDGDVGQQRGRHRPADRRGGRDRPRPRHPRAHRRRPGARPAAARLRRRGCRRDDGHRAQDRRTLRRGCPRRTTRAAAHRPAPRRWPGARHPVRHHRPAGDRRVSRWRASSPSSASPSSRRGW